MRNRMHKVFIKPLVLGLALALGGVAHANPTSLGAFGWAAPKGSAVVAKGGHGADAAHTYTVINRTQLIKALYPDAVIAADGSFTSAAGADNTPKIIYIKGKVDLSTNAAGVPLGFADFKDPAYDFNAYVAAYKPSVWNANPANWNATTKKPILPFGAQEDARKRSQLKQASITTIAVGSNTSLLGLATGAQIRNGQILVKDVQNVVIRNITFEDAFDHFPEWDPGDSFVLDATKPGCQDTYVNATTGPQMCHGGRWNSEYDTVSVLNSKYVWVDHCSFNDGSREDYLYPSVFSAPHVGYDYIIQHHDGALDVTGSSDFVTISNNRFKNHDKTNLLGSSNTATAANGWGALSITVAYNYYENAGQRLPRVRFGKVHVYNNYFTGRIGYLGAYAPTTNVVIPKNRYLYGIGVGNLAKLYVENNTFEIQDAPSSGTGAIVDDSVMFYVWHGANQTINGVLEKTYFYDKGTLLNGKARSITTAAAAASTAAGKPVPESTPTIWTPSSNYSYSLKASKDVKNYVINNAGAGKL